MFGISLRSDNLFIGRWIDTKEQYSSLPDALLHAKYLAMTTGRTARVRRI